MSDMYNALKTLHAALEVRDPLLERGVGRDWVCVINPADESALRAEFKRLYPQEAVNGLGLQRDWLSMMVGRDAFQIVDAPRGSVQYMPRAEMYRRYAAYFIRELRLRKRMAMRERLHAGDAQRVGGQGI